jgi:hypothetical protein
VARLFEKRSRHGQRYLTGRLGLAKVIILETSETSETNPVWYMKITTGPAVENGPRVPVPVKKVAVP